jgi:hypothetical protein
LQEILSDRESIAQTMQVSIKNIFLIDKKSINIFQAALDEGTEGWGVRVERVEVYVESSSCHNMSVNTHIEIVSSKDVRLPVQLQR